VTHHPVVKSYPLAGANRRADPSSTVGYPDSMSRRTETRRARCRPAGAVGVTALEEGVWGRNLVEVSSQLAQLNQNPNQRRNPLPNPYDQPSNRH